MVEKINKNILRRLDTIERNVVIIEDRVSNEKIETINGTTTIITSQSVLHVKCMRMYEIEMVGKN